MSDDYEPLTLPGFVAKLVEQNLPNLPTTARKLTNQQAFEERDQLLKELDKKLHNEKLIEMMEKAEQQCPGLGGWVGSHFAQQGNTFLKEFSSGETQGP